MAGIDAKTLAAAQQYAEQLGLGGAGLQEKVNEQVHVYLENNPETEFLNIKKTGAKGDGVTDDSACFTEGVPGYIVNDGTYCVDGSTMARLNASNCIGNGYLKLYNPQLWGHDGSEKWYDVFDYTIAVKDLDDFLQKTMVSASEADYFAGLNRKNATAMLKPLEGQIYAHTIGAIYKVQNAVLPDNFTVCISNLHLYSVTTDKILRRIRVNKKLNTGMFAIYELPWTSHITRSLSTDKYKIFDDYTEFYLTPSDFEPSSEETTEATLHFWGANVDLGERDDIIGVICCFDFWVKEKEVEDKLILQIGVDQMDYNTKTTKQACSGIAMKTKTYPRTQWATSMNRELIKKYCDTNNLLELHGLSSDISFNNYSVASSSKEYEGQVITMNDSDIYYKMFTDSKKYRGYMNLNPVKHMKLPYYSTSGGSTGSYCKLFHIPYNADSTNRFVFKIDIFRHSSTKSSSMISCLLTLIKNGYVNIDTLSSVNIKSKGLLTIVITDNTIDVYAKGEAWGYTTVDIELVAYSSFDIVGDIHYDTDLLRIGAGSYNIMCDKWTTVDTTDCTVIESGITTALEDRVAELESKIAELTSATTTTE